MTSAHKGRVLAPVGMAIIVLLACAAMPRAVTARPPAPLAAASGYAVTRTPSNSQQAADQTPLDELAGRHRQWLTEAVVYIISPIEREAFLLLESDAERDAFMDAFWRVRDPTPGTIRNEAREEHQRRITYANRYLGSETPRRGWQTDRGRVYIQLGEPADKQTWPDPRAFYPIELWFYRSDPTVTGLPPFFYVMFFRPLQGGEYKMYDPITDGPGALAKDMMLQMGDAREVVRRLLTGIGHEVATASVNLIPSEQTDFSRPRPSARNNFLFNAIEQAPLKGLDDRYARDFLLTRGDVEAAVVFDTLPVQLYAVAFWDRRGLPYLHYGIELPKDTALLGEFEGDYALSLRLGYEVEDVRGQQILLDGDIIEEHFDEERARQIAAAPLAYYDRVELVPGAYKLTINLGNRLTQEDSVTSTRLSVANAVDTGAVLSDLLVAAKTSPLPETSQNDEPAAFQFDGEQFFPAAGGRLPLGGTAELFMQIVAPPEPGQVATVEAVAALLDEEGNEVLSTRGSPIAVQAPPSPTSLRLSLPLAGADLGPHTLRLSAVLSDGRSLSREARVEVVNRPLFQSPEVFLATEERLEGIEEYQRRGWQHLRKGELRAAEAYVSIALESEPDNLGLRRSLAGIEINLGEYAAAVAVMRPVAQPTNASSIDLLIYSQALRGYGAAAEAAAAARRVLQRGPTAGGYNALAEALVDLGNTAEAIAAYEASLAILPDQPAVREALAALRDGEGPSAPAATDR